MTSNSANDALVLSPNGVAEYHNFSTIPQGRTFLPGEPVLFLAPGAVVAIGSGLIPSAKKVTVNGVEGDIITAALCGVVHKVQLAGRPVKYFLESPTVKRYIPRLGDPVVGIITKSSAQSYSLNINGAQLASLDTLAFDGASKTNRPNLRPGDVVYCHVIRADTDVETELSCAAVGGNATKDWTTGESTFGPLYRGTIVRVPIAFAKNMLEGTIVTASQTASVSRRPEDYANHHNVLAQLGERVPYEVCIGLNGAVWVRAIDTTAAAHAAAAGGAAAAAQVNKNIAGNAAPVGGDPALPTTIAIAECIREAQMDQTEEAVKARVSSYFPYMSA